MNKMAVKKIIKLGYMYFVMNFSKQLNKQNYFICKISEIKLKILLPHKRLLGNYSKRNERI